jgi:photosystem II stability/assembly factor-like uncharacterized protein
VNQHDVDALDRALDGQPASGVPAAGDSATGLLTVLARLPAAEWPDRAAGDRIQAGVAAALGLSTPAGTPRTAPAHRGSWRVLRAPRALLGAAAAVGLAAAAVAVVSTIGPARPAAPSGASRFRATVLASSTPRPSAPGQQPGRWQLASYLTVPGWQPGQISKPLDSLSCPTAMTCYLLAAHPVAVRSAPGRFSILEVSQNGGASWTALGLPTSISIATPLQCPVSATACVAAGTDAGHVIVLRTADGGRSWTTRPVRPGARYADQLTCSTDLACTGIFKFGRGPDGRYAVLVTDNGGRTWSAGPASPRGQAPDYLACRGRTCVLFDQASQAAQAPANWTTWFSRDGGQRWQLAQHPATAWPIASNGLPVPGAVSCADQRHCWAVMTTSASPGSPAILATADGGAHWSVQPVRGPLARAMVPLAISCPTARQCWVGGSRGSAPLLLATADGGGTWSTVRLPSHRGAVRATGILPGIGLISCPAANRCVTIPLSNPNARRVPVYRLGGTG